MALRKKLGKMVVSTTLALAVLAGGAFCLAPTKVYADEGALPSSYQLDITPFEVGNQGLSALCWAYSSSKVLETYIYNSFSPQVALNISEDWLSLAYMYYVNDTENTLVTDSALGADNASYQYGETGLPHFFQRVVNTYGIMLEEDFDFTGEITTANFQTVFNTYKSKLKTDIIENLEFSWIGYYPGVQANYTQETVVNAIKTYLSSEDYAKSAIYTGAVGVSGKGTNTPYVWHETSSALSHALTIIGYDDTKVVNIDGEGAKTGAFILLNSYGDDDQIVYMPYDMFAPDLQEDGIDTYEANNVISNTFFVSGGSVPTDSSGGQEGAGDGGSSGSGDGQNPGAGAGGEGGSSDGAGSGENAGPEGDGTEDGGEVIPEETLSFWETIMAKPDAEKALMGVAAGVVVIFLLVGLGFMITAINRRRQTNTINQQVLAHNFAKYQSHRLNLERQKKELDEELQKIRDEQKRKKQRRLKRQFNKNVNTGSGGPEA